MEIKVKAKVYFGGDDNLEDLLAGCDVRKAILEDIDINEWVIVYSNNAYEYISQEDLNNFTGDIWYYQKINKMNEQLLASNAFKKYYLEFIKLHTGLDSLSELVKEFKRLKTKKLKGRS